MGIVEDYLQTHAEQVAKHGARTLVLYEVGTFLEFYSDGTTGAAVDDVCALLNIQSTRKNKSVVEVSSKNPKLGGFPTHALAKYEPLLTEGGYTVVYVGREGTPSAPERRVTRIVSKTTDPASQQQS